LDNTPDPSHILGSLSSKENVFCWLVREFLKSSNRIPLLPQMITSESWYGLYAEKRVFKVIALFIYTPIQCKNDRLFISHIFIDTDINIDINIINLQLGSKLNNLIRTFFILHDSLFLTFLIFHDGMAILNFIDEEVI